MERIYEFNATKIRNILYCDRCRKINLLHIFKAKTKVSLEIDFFIFIKRKSASLNALFNLSFFKILNFFIMNPFHNNTIISH